MSHLRLGLLLCGLVPIALPGSVIAAEEPAKAGDTISWIRQLPRAFEDAQKEGKPLMICINSERVDGGRVEAAAKELREVTYRDPRVVTRSRAFICAWLTAEGSSDDFGELRARFHIEGLIVSPQHVFARPNGDLLSRHEYWPHGTGERSIKALLELMDAALAKEQAARAVPPSAPTPAPAPPGGSPNEPAAPAAPGADAAAPESARLLALVVTGPTDARREALRRLLSDDKEGRNLAALLALLPRLAEAKDVAAQVDVARAFGRPGLQGAVAALLDWLDAKDDDLRANAAVSLEYVGSPEACTALRARLDKERVESVSHHLLRALGRCGVGDAKSRATLDRRVTSAKTEATACAAIVGLAYFEKDTAAARVLDEQLGKVGPPAFGRRGGGGENAAKRVFLAWALAEVGDPKSAEVVRKKILAPLENVQNPWIVRIRGFYQAVAEVCEGRAERRSEVEAGIQVSLEFFGGNPLMDDARRGRDATGFTPKADWEVTPRAGGGPGPGAPGGGAPGGGDGK